MAARPRVGHTTTPFVQPELPSPDPLHWLHAMTTQADRALVDHPPAPTLLSEETWSHSAHDPVLVSAVVEPVGIHGPTVAPGRFRGTGGRWIHRKPGPASWVGLLLRTASPG